MTMIARVQEVLLLASLNPDPDLGDVARDCIAAMREPTAEVELAYFGFTERDALGDDIGGRAWQAMIDAALKEG